MTPASPDDQDRSDMAQLVAGHDPALDNLMSRHAQRLFHYLLRILQNEADASDLAQETFVRVFQNCAKFRGTHKFSTWLYAIATNLARDVQRYRARHPQVSLDAGLQETESDLGQMVSDTKPNPGETMVSTERAEAVRHAIAALPEELRTPLVLFTYE